MCTYDGICTNVFCISACVCAPFIHSDETPIEFELSQTETGIEFRNKVKILLQSNKLDARRQVKMPKVMPFIDLTFFQIEKLFDCHSELHLHVCEYARAWLRPT